MSDFGFDSNILLSAPRLSLESAEAGQATARTAQMQRDLRRQQSLSDIVSQNAGAYNDPAAQALASGGFQEQADAAQQQAVQRQASAAKLMQLHADITRSQLASAGPEQTQKIIDNLQDNVRDRYGLPRQYDASDPEHTKAIQTFVASGMEPEKQGAYIDATQRRSDLADPETPTYKATAAFLQRIGVPVEPRMNLNGFSDKMEATAEKLAAAQALAASRLGMVPGGGGTLPAISDPAMDIKVTNAVKTGEVPKFGSGPLGARKEAAFWNRLAEMYPGADLASNKAGFRANMHSYQEGQAQTDVQDVKEAKALADIKVLRGTMKGLFDTGNPLLNAVGRSFQEKSGDPAYAAFRTARETALPAINATMNSGQMSVGARDEVKDLLRKDDSLKSLDAALGIIEQDMARSKAASHQRLSNVRARLSAKPGTAPAEESSGSSSPTAASGAVDHSAAADWLRDPKSKASPYYQRNLDAYKKAHGGLEP